MPKTVHTAWACACAQAKNEELAQRTVGASQEELEATRAEFEARLGAAERKARRRHEIALHLADRI